MSQYDVNPQPDLPMKWHKFLIYFALWAGMLFLIISAFSFLTGSMYGSSSRSEAVYMRYPGLKTLDLLCGVVTIGIAVFTIYTRFQLAGFKSGAPTKLIILYILSTTVTLIYLFGASSVTGISISDLSGGTTINNCVISIIMIFINRNYYSKRSHLFVN